MPADRTEQDESFSLSNTPGSGKQIRLWSRFITLVLVVLNTRQDQLSSIQVPTDHKESQTIKYTLVKSFWRIKKEKMVPMHHPRLCKLKRSSSEYQRIRKWSRYKTASISIHSWKMPMAALPELDQYLEYKPKTKLSKLSVEWRRWKMYGIRRKEY